MCLCQTRASVKGFSSAVQCRRTVCNPTTVVVLQVFPHEYQRAMAEAAAIKKAEEEQKAAIKAAGW